ncbi:MAG TPA: hypothetical protein PLP50_15750 [Thermoanaerobaculia bacterium]|nr:hypothetical protein [Thermoanaerobaculia bacterium]HPA53047.1 hypothetical protein [Thermoanaerobaculia bacterium]HQN08677.1 hypothetical protein [Thermoanaerobaculia bacterium]HQP86145.1 hypothetical protein [Thermoanaerobaculia bacterium]
MSTSIVDLKTIHDAYTRLTEKFKTFWTFHQFLQGVHKTFFGDAPGYNVDFQGLYDEIRAVTTVMNVEPPPVVIDRINQLDGRLDVVYRALSADDEKIAASWVRRFFEKVRTEDEKLLLAILRFYFHARQVSPEALDKMDFLLTLVGARRSLDDGRYLPRFPQELTKLFAALLGLVRRSPAPAAELTAAVKALGLLKKDIDSCERFEELTEKKILDSLRTVKHRLGPAFYDSNVLSAILDANLAAKNRFQALYRSEEKRIFESSQQLLDIERELSRRPEVADAELQEEFRRFRQFKDEFDKNRGEGEIRHAQVTRLAETIDQLMSKLDAAGEAPGEQIPEILPLPDEELSEAQETVSGYFPGRIEGAAPPEPVKAARAKPAVATDPLLGEVAAKILYSVDMLQVGAGSGQAAYGSSLSRLRLEPWEVRAARRVQSEDDRAPDAETAANDDLFLEGAALRLRIDEAAQVLKAPSATAEDGKVLEMAAECLVRAQDLDRRFRQSLEAVGTEGPPERLNELTRSRFRLLRAFSGLWLLHNARASAGE